MCQKDLAGIVGCLKDLPSQALGLRLLGWRCPFDHLVLALSWVETGIHLGGLLYTLRGLVFSPLCCLCSDQLRSLCILVASLWKWVVGLTPLYPSLVGKLC